MCNLLSGLVCLGSWVPGLLWGAWVPGLLCFLGAWVPGLLCFLVCLVFVGVFAVNAE